MEYDCGYINGVYGAFTFEDPLSEDENEDIHHAVQYSILESKSAEMNFVESSYTEEDEHHTGSVQGSTEHSDESVRQRQKASITPRKRWWRKLFSSLNIFKKFKQYDVTSWESSTSERDSNCQIDQVCDVCDEAILSDGLMRTYWGQTACDRHLSDGTTKCCSCKRFKLGNMRYISLSDGRKLCADCHCTAVMDTETCIPLFHEVYRFLEGINMKILEDIPIFLVDKHEINKIDTEHGGKDQPKNLLGLTTYGGAGFVVRSVARSY